MDDKAWQLLIQDIKEIKVDIKDVRSEVSSLKITAAAFSSVFGIIGAYLSKFLGIK